MKASNRLTLLSQMKLACFLLYFIKCRSSTLDVNTLYVSVTLWRAFWQLPSTSFISLMHLSEVGSGLAILRQMHEVASSLLTSLSDCVCVWGGGELDLSHRSVSSSQVRDAQRPSRRVQGQRSHRRRRGDHRLLRVPAARQQLPPDVAQGRMVLPVQMPPMQRKEANLCLAD